MEMIVIVELATEHLDQSKEKTVGILPSSANTKELLC